MYISSLGSSPAFTSTGKVLDSLRPNSSPRSVGQRLQPVEHGDGVLVLQVLLEVVVIEGDVVIAHLVQNGAGSLIAQDEWGCT